MDAVTLAELLCARLCHDMSGPVGAAAAGAELIADMGDGVDAETLALVSASAGAGSARLKFFRAALGPAASGTVAIAALREQVDGYLSSLASSGLRVELDWRAGPAGLGGDAARLMLNLIVLAKDALPRGGRIVVAVEDGLPRVEAYGEPAALSGDVAAVLEQGAAPGSPREAQAYLARTLAHRAGGGLRTEVRSGGLAFLAAPQK